MKLPRKPSFYIWSAATLIIMAVIFVFSSFETESSDSISISVTSAVIKNVDAATGMLSTPPPNSPENSKTGKDSAISSGTFFYNIFKDINMVVLTRKSAHVISFALMGFCVAKASGHITSGLKLFIFTMVFTSLYAASDEFHQYFVPGRVADIRDWALDTLGALAGTGIAMLHIRLRRRKTADTRDMLPSLRD